MAVAGDGTRIRFGISLVPATDNLAGIRELVRVADEAGLDLVGIQDHPYQRRFLDTWSPGESVEALEEAIAVIRLLWSEERSVSFEGTYYRLDRAHPGPRPAHSIGIWLGAFKPRMLRLVGRKADGWLPSLGVLTRDELRAGNQQIDATAEKAGRDPGSIRRIVNVQGVIGDQPAPSRSELPVGYLAGEPLAGSADWWIETIASFVDDGFDTVVFWPVDASPGQVELVAGDVAPRFRRPG